MKTIETEYHFILVCPAYRDLRQKYFSSYYCHWPTVYKFESLMSSKKAKIQIKLSRYVYEAFLRRQNTPRQIMDNV